MTEVLEKRKKNMKKTLDGFVVSTKMDKTIVVKCERKTKHPVYGKIVTRSKKFLVHDENNECTEGCFVRIMETRPLSRRKHWRLVKILKKVE